MKFGKTYLESLEQVPEEWRQQAIEYRKLKKVINRVASELEELGLTSEVLRELLDSQRTNTTSAAPAPAAASNGAANRETSRPRRSPSDSTLRKRSTTVQFAPSSPPAPAAETGQRTETRIEEVLDEAEGVLGVPEDSTGDEDPGLSVAEAEGGQAVEGNGRINGKGKEKGKVRKVRKRRVRASYELGGTTAHPEPRIHLVFSSASSSSYSSASDDDGAHTPSSSTSDFDEPSSPSRFLFARHVQPLRRRSKGKGRVHEEDEDPSGDGGEAGAGPRITELPSDEDERPGAADGGGSVTEETNSVPDELEEVEFEGAGPKANGLLRRMYGVGRRSDEEPDEEGEGAVGEAAPAGERRRRASEETLKRMEKEETDAGRGDRKDIKEKQKRVRKEERRAERAEEAAHADDEGAEKHQHRHRRRRPRQHRKEVFIPLTSDTEFLTLLASAVNSLATLQLAQKRQFSEAVELLAREVSNVSSPSRPKTDLYIWREIFALWVEAAIFESDRELDRGERGVEEVEKRLDWFVEQVAKRKLAKRMKHKESRVALEKFIALNVELLDLKKFQVANEEAARKIVRFAFPLPPSFCLSQLTSPLSVPKLKKHDKRTALTASLGFPKFIAAAPDISSELIRVASPSASSANGDQRRVLTLPGFPSLPHILLSTFTNTLLPIIPQLEDYECSICGDVAFKPIRLSCGHKFCVRCLVKMQKRGQDNCPQCRSAVVLRANAGASPPLLLSLSLSPPSERPPLTCPARLPSFVARSLAQTGNLDMEMQQFLLRWFPHEVKQKERNNYKEAAREELEEMGIVDRKCKIM
ncbi:SPOSA6832_02585, partial [Sporobolomyces salmonicolor]